MLQSMMSVLQSLHELDWLVFH